MQGVTVARSDFDRSRVPEARARRVVQSPSSGRGTRWPLVVLPVVATFALVAAVVAVPLQQGGTPALGPWLKDAISKVLPGVAGSGEGAVSANGNLLVPASPPRVAFLGDSISRGNSDIQGGGIGDMSWFYGMVAGPDAPLIYAGGAANNGKTTQWMLEQINVALRERPDMLVVLGGTNDVAYWMTADQTIANLQEIVYRSAEKGVLVAVSTIPPTADETLKPKVAALNDAIRAWAPEAEVVLIDPWSILAEPDGSWKLGYSDDGIHPNVATAALMSAYAAPVILDAWARHISG